MAVVCNLVFLKVSNFYCQYISIFRMAAVLHLKLSKFQILLAIMVQRVN